MLSFGPGDDTLPRIGASWSRWAAPGPLQGSRALGACPSNRFDDFDENTLPRRLRFRICSSIAIIGACPNENFVSRDLAISDYSDRLLDLGNNVIGNSRCPSRSTLAKAPVAWRARSACPVIDHPPTRASAATMVRSTMLVDFLVTPDERREMALACAASAAPCPNDPE